MDITMEYRFSDSYLLVFLQQIYAPKDTKGRIHAFKLLGRPYKDMTEFIINSSIYECESVNHFLNFDPSKNMMLHGVGIAYPENGLVKMLEIANQHQSQL